MKKNFFGMTDEEFLDKKMIKILNGIGGSAKSSNTDKILKAHDEPYARHTSTNKLKRDAELRYGGYCETIAGGLFKTINGVFFARQKVTEFSTVVIDEILQTDSRVLDWIAENVGKVNIIVCTDTHQMLSPECGKSFYRKFMEFCKRPDVILVELTKTYRARTKETEDYYKKCYDSVTVDKSLFYSAKKQFEVIPFAAMPYNHNDVYICHTNAIEKYLFQQFRIGEDYDAPLIPKGGIAKKPPKNPEKYPILCQSDTKSGVISYYQPEHVGTPTRYQGSEVTESQTLYYLVESFSRVESREWYTVVSRCYDIRSIKIVICDVPRSEPLKTYNGKPVKNWGFFNLQQDIVLADGRKLSEVCDATDGREVLLSDEDMAALSGVIADNATTHYRDNVLIFNGKVVKREKTEEEKTKEEEAKSKKTSSMGSLLKKEPDFSYGECMPDFFRSMELVQRMRYEGSGCEVDYISSPHLINDERMCENPLIDQEGYDTRKKRESYQYGIDMRASYPFILNYAKIATSGGFYRRPDELRDDPYQTKINTGKIDWYMSWGSPLIPDGSICSGDVARFLQSRGLNMMLYIGTSDYKIGSLMGSRLYDMATRSFETNEKRKAIHYGWAEKPWLERIKFNGEIDGYCINQQYDHQLMMLSVKNQQTLNILTIKDIVYNGNLRRGFVVMDGLYFDYDGDISELGEKIHAALPEYDFRIFENGELDKNGKILYQTYEPLKTKRELKAEQQRQRRARK